MNFSHLRSKVAVSKVLVHKHFNLSSGEHDIALLKLGKLASPTLPLTVCLQ